MERFGANPSNSAPSARLVRQLGFDPPVNFHGLRHTYASRLATKAVPFAVIAVQLGHADTRMVEKHDGHLSPSYVAETVRAAFGSLGIVEPSNITSILPAASVPVRH